MPREIKTTLAVDGEAAFRRAINEANNSLRNMGSQLTLATAQFKKDGDAMKLVETRSKALKGEIGQQNEIVKALEKAVSDSAKAFGENSEKTEKWQAELNRAKAKLTNLQSELTLNEAGLDRNGKAFDESSQKAADYQATLTTIGKNVSFETVTNGLGKITDGFENAFKKVVNFGKKIRDTMVDAGTWADELITDATKYGMDVETLQRWRNAADFIDTDVEAIIQARDKLAQKMKSGWTEGSGNDKIDLWEMLGVDITEAGKYKDSMDVLWDLGETLKSMVAEEGNDVRADALAMQVFGRSYKELMPLFAAGREEWEKTVAEQRVVSEAHVKALGEMDDANQELNHSWETLQHSVLAELAPVLTDATSALADLLNQFNDWVETDEGKEAMSDLSTSLRELFSGITDVKFSDAIDAAKTGLNALRSGLAWLRDNKDGVYTGLKVIAGGFGLLKVSETVLKFLQLKNGIQGLNLFGKGNGNGTSTGTGTGNGSSPIVPTGGSLFGRIGTTVGQHFGAVNMAGNLLGMGLMGGMAVGDLTRFGQTLRTGGTIAEAFEESGKVIQQNAETFVDDWKNNPIFKFFETGFNTTGANAMSLWNSLFGSSGTPETPEDREARQGAAMERLEALFGEHGAGWTQAPGFEDAIREAWAAFEGQEEKLDRLIDEMESRGVVENVELDPQYTREQQLDAAQDWWDAWRNAANGQDSWKEEDNAWHWMQEVFGEDFGTVMDSLLHRLDEYGEAQMFLKDLPAEWLGGSDILTNAIREAMFNSGAGPVSGTWAQLTGGEQLTGSDLREFRGLPGQMQDRVQLGVQRGISGLRVTIDGYAAGRILAPYVAEALASGAQ